MDNLISKWKQTVENHNRKLSQLREDSLGASSRTHSLTASRVAPVISGSLTMHNKNGAYRGAHSTSSSSSRGSSHDAAERERQLEKENRVPNQVKKNIQAGKQIEDETVKTLIESILELYPECKTKSKKSEQLRELITKRCYREELLKIDTLRHEIKANEQARREQAYTNEQATKRVAELEQKIQESEKERHKQRVVRDQLI